jgi:hypothetical protein
VLVRGNERRRDAARGEELRRVARVLGENHRDATQDLSCACAQVREIADRCRDDVQRAGFAAGCGAFSG